MAKKYFTCLESFVLIAIVAVLGAILIPTISLGPRPRPVSTILEISQLTLAFEAYKHEFGDYPPDFSDRSVLEEHLQIAFSISEQQVDDWLSAEVTTRNPRALDAAEAIVFWLGSLSKDPKRPFLDSEEKYCFFEFDESRLIDADGDGWQEYGSKCLPSVPYVYIDARSISSCRYPDSPIEGIEGTARAYQQSIEAEEDFQIISAGRDGDYGTSLDERVYPDGTGYSDGDLDNITSFSDGMILENAIP